MATSDDDLRAIVRRNVKTYREQLGLMALAGVFGCTMNDLFEADPPPSDPTKVTPVSVTWSGTMDDDLRRRLEDAINGVTREHFRRIRHRPPKS